MYKQTRKSKLGFRRLLIRFLLPGALLVSACSSIPRLLIRFLLPGAFLLSARSSLLRMRIPRELTAEVAPVVHDHSSDGPINWKVRPAPRGVYFLASDGVLDNTIAFLNSFRHFNPTMPLAMIPYDESKCEKLFLLAKTYDFDVHFEPQLFRQIDHLSEVFYENGVTSLSNRMYRKLSIWDGPFEEFLYLDVDSVVLDSVDFAFDLLDKHADVMTTHSNYPHLKQWVWEDTIDESGLLSPEQIVFSANMGSILSSKRFASTTELVQKAVADAPLVKKYFARKDGAGLNDQGALNWLVVTSGKRYSSFSNLAHGDRVPDLVKLEFWAGGDELPKDVIITEDYRLEKLYDQEHPVFFAHWTGPKCSNPGVSLPTCAMWNHWRNIRS